MKEFKVNYSHYEARNILVSLGARCEKTTHQKDIYLVNDKDDIVRLVEKDEKCYITHLAKKEGGFVVDLKKDIMKSIADDIKILFDTSQVIEKKREHYVLKDGLRVVLDSVQGLGEFVEIYTESNIKDILKLFKIDMSDTIKESYYDLLSKK